MFRSTSRITRIAGAALVTGAVAAPGALASSPDADALNAEAIAARQIDNRAPDTVDQAEGVRIGETPIPKIVKVPVEVRVPAAGGIDWADVAIGAGGAVGLVLMAGGAAVTVTRRRHPAGLA